MRPMTHLYKNYGYIHTSTTSIMKNYSVPVTYIKVLTHMKTCITQPFKYMALTVTCIAPPFTSKRQNDILHKVGVQ